VRTWILSIVHCRGIDQLRSSATRYRTQDSFEASATVSQPSQAFSETWRNSRRAQVRQAWRELTRRHLQVLERAYFSEYTHRDIADLLDLPLVTKERRMRLGLQKIRGHLDSHGIEVPG
jgi:RNA polymerase sigma-70 factor, ECF subfamily